MTDDWVFKLKMRTNEKEKMKIYLKVVGTRWIYSRDNALETMFKHFYTHSTYRNMKMLLYGTTVLVQRQ